MSAQHDLRRYAPQVDTLQRELGLDERRALRRALRPVVKVTSFRRKYGDFVKPFIPAPPAPPAPLASSDPLVERIHTMFMGIAALLQEPVFAFGRAWHDALGRCAAGRPSAQFSAILRTMQQLGSLGPLREPHIEDFEGEIRFTWNRDGHYIEVSVSPAGEVEWFHGLPDGTFVGDDGHGLDAKFHRALEHARP